jgi:hypothetical protein
MGDAPGKRRAAHQPLIGFSRGQTCSRHREANDDALWLPVSGDFAFKARNSGANEKFAEPVVTHWRCDFGPSALCPGNDEGLSVVRALDLDSPGHSRKRTMFGGVCRELVEQQRKAGNHRPRNLDVTSRD